MRVVTWCVYTALFSLCTVTFSISFLNGVRTCMHMFNSRGLPFLLQSHFLVLGAKHCEIFMYLFIFLLKCAKNLNNPLFFLLKSHLLIGHKH